MLKDERLDKIVELVNEKGKKTVNRLANLLEVTPETIRRDLSELEEEGKVSRVHGGAIPYQSSSKELLFNRKMSVNEEEKRQIARNAAMLIEDGDMVAVDGGTTTVHMPDFFHHLSNVKIVTNSLVFAVQYNKAAEEGRVTGELIFTPGILYVEQNTIRGSMTVEFLSNCVFDKAFISCGGITDEIVTEFDFEEAEISKMMMRQSKKNYLLADHDKFNVARAFKIADTKAFDEIITINAK